MSRSLSLSARVLALFLVLLGLVAAAEVGSPPKEAPAVQAAWKEIDRLIDEDKLQEASARLDELLDALQKAGDDAAWTRALLRAAQLRAAIGQPEAAVRFLQTRPWPEDRQQRAIVSLFYAETLDNYFRHYRWKLWQNQAIQSKEPVDVDKWTTGQLFEAASKAYLDAWTERDTLGGIPVDTLPGILQPNNYPREVRGTLRDSVTYLWVELLADTGYWSPAQSNETSRLDIPALFHGAEKGEVAEDRLDDPEVHPLVRLVTVLADLERWHRSQNNLDGALEAHLERLRRLRNHAQPAETAVLRKGLEDDLPAFREVPWWAMGMAELAELYQADNDLVRALEAARAGAEAWPESPGGERCRTIVREIEAPVYSLSGMASDGLARRSFRVDHRNLDALWFRAYPVDLRQGLPAAGPIFPQRDVEALLRQGRPAFSWKADLPATPDYQMHATYVTPAIDRPGAYLVVVSRREDFAPKENQLAAIPIVLGDLVLLARHQGGEVEVTALSGDDGEPVPGVEVRIYRSEGWERRALAATRTTGADGRLVFRAGARERLEILGRKGDNIALVEGLSSYYGPPEEEAGASSLVFTDRSIYRPQQKLLWKVLVYERKDVGRFEGVARTSVTVSLLDPNGQAVEQRTVATNALGTASGEFLIPPGRPLGAWRIETSRRGEAWVRVEEYKRPTFEVSLEDPDEPLRLGRPATFTGEARYYFGLPVAHGQVRWRATRETRWFWSWWNPPGGEEIVATGTADLSPDGTFEIRFTPEAGDPKGRDPRQMSFGYRIDAELTDEGGETRTAERSFRLGWVAIEAAIEPDRSLYEAGKPGVVTLRRRDLAGIGRPGEGTWTLVALRQPAETRLPADLPQTLSLDEPERALQTEGDRLRPRSSSEYDPREVLRSWEDGPQVSAGTVLHDLKGEARLTLPALAPGVYRLRYETADESGEIFSTSQELIVAGEELPLALPAILEVSSAQVRPGQTLRVLAHSGLPGQLVWLETWREGKLLRRRELRMGRDAGLVEISIGPDERGGFTLQLVTLRDHQLLELRRDVLVPWDDRRLEIEVATFRDRIRPGSGETWTVKVKGAGGETAAAELLAYMYDRSLDVFAPHQPPDLLDLYPNRTGGGQVDSSLRPSHPGWTSGSTWHGSSRFQLRPDQVLVWMVRRYSERETAGGLEVAVPSAAPLMDERRLSTAVAQGIELDAQAPPPPPPPPPAPAKAAPQPAPVELRSDFSETAFWQPHLITGPDGVAAIEFTVPDSVTSWSFWVHALTRDLRAGRLQTEVRSVKDLMVRPYVPRFLREADRAELEVVVNNASEGELRGEVVLDIVDPETEASLLADFGLDPSRARAGFTVTPGGGTSVTFPLTTPRRVGPVAFKVTAVSGDLSDGELRPLPVLPSRVHLVQSRFAALPGAGSRELRFEDLARNDDPTRIDEQMVVTLDAQLFYGVLEALPYLVQYPYECTEQTLNRFLSTGIASSLFDEYPAVAAMAKEMSKRETRYETWDATDPNRRMALEETPWLQISRGGSEESSELIKILDPRVSRAQRDEALAKLRQAQHADGGFPWFPGGRPSPYMTVYILYGFAKAAELGVEVPRDVVERGWSWLGRWYRTEEAPRLADNTWSRELLVFLNYVATAYPDPSWMGGEALSEAERKKILALTFAEWKSLSGYPRALLALTLKRMGRPADSKLVFDSILDRARTTPEEGTFWAPEERAWLWYNDRIETHAFALRAMMEIAPEDPRRHGLVQWLFLNKQLNHWRSTRATAEVIYALVHYLEKEGQLGVREEATVRVAGQRTTFTFEPDRYTGKRNQVVVPGEKIDPATTATVVVEKASPGLMFASATWHFSTDRLPTEARGDLFGVTRRYFLRSGAGNEIVLKPLEEGTVLRPGDEVEVHLAITARSAAEFVHLRDPRPAGLEPDGARSGYKWELLGYYEETRDSGTNFFFDWLPAGEHTLKYRVRANMAGTFRTGPATLQSMYAPEFAAYSAGDVLTVASAPK